MKEVAPKQEKKSPFAQKGDYDAWRDKNGWTINEAVLLFSGFTPSAITINVVFDEAARVAKNLKKSNAHEDNVVGDWLQKMVDLASIINSEIKKRYAEFNGHWPEFPENPLCFRFYSYRIQNIGGSIRRAVIPVAAWREFANECLASANGLRIDVPIFDMPAAPPKSVYHDTKQDVVDPEGVIDDAADDSESEEDPVSEYISPLENSNRYLGEKVDALEAQLAAVSKCEGQNTAIDRKREVLIRFYDEVLKNSPFFEALKNTWFIVRQTYNPDTSPDFYKIWATQLETSANDSHWGNLESTVGGKKRYNMSDGQKKAVKELLSPWSERKGKPNGDPNPVSHMFDKSPKGKKTG